MCVHRDQCQRADTRGARGSSRRGRFLGFTEFDGIGHVQSAVSGQLDVLQDAEVVEPQTIADARGSFLAATEDVAARLRDGELNESAQVESALQTAFEPLTSTLETALAPSDTDLIADLDDTETIEI